MSQEFVQKICEGFQGGHHKLSLQERVVVFCPDVVPFEGVVVGFCPEGLLVGCDQMDVWINSEAIAAVARCRKPGGGGGGGIAEACVPPNSPGQMQPPVANGNEPRNRVFCNGSN